MNITIVPVAPTIDTAAYTANDTLFATTAVPGRYYSGKIKFIEIIDADDVGEAAVLYFLASNVAFGTINVAPSITDANAKEIIGATGTITAGTDLGGVRVGHLVVDIPFSVGGSLYVAGVTTTALTHTAAGVSFNVGIELA